MKNVSIEYAHIYTNTEINKDHAFSVKILSTIYEELEKDNQAMSLVVMIDDYSFPDPSFDYQHLYTWLVQENFTPDIMIRESQLIPDCDVVIELVSQPSLKKELTEYIREKKKYPCSLFIAT